MRKEIVIGSVVARAHGGASLLDPGTNDWRLGGRSASFQIALLTSAEEARRLSTSGDTVRRLLEARELAGLCIEGQRRKRCVTSSPESDVAESERVQVSIQEAAARFGLTTVIIRAWTKDGRLESYQVEGDRRVYVAEESAPGS